MRARHATAAALLLLIPACEKMGREQAGQAPPPPASAPSAPASSSAGMAARGLHVRGEAYPTYGAYGYVVFTSATPAPDDTLLPGRKEKRARHLAACAAFGDLPSVAGFEAADSLNLMVTFWPTERMLPPDSTASCAALLRAYDGALAARILAVVGHQGAKGPLLVAFAHPFVRSASSRGALVYDLSGFPPADLGRAFRVWNEEIVQRPELWNRGFKLARIREAVRNALNLAAAGMPADLVSLVASRPAAAQSPGKHD